MNNTFRTKSISFTPPPVLRFLTFFKSSTPLVRVRSVPNRNNVHLNYNFCCLFRCIIKIWPHSTDPASPLKGHVPYVAEQIRLSQNKISVGVFESHDTDETNQYAEEKDAFQKEFLQPFALVAMGDRSPRTFGFWWRIHIQKNSFGV
ncbi:hypothetical protein TNCV_4615731 [Trichonephila clavipes]|nr:hypothetical protein TNCV_4615731 [Trichonephila clavipes]